MGTPSSLEPESKAVFTEIAAKLDSLVTAIADQYGLFPHQVLCVVTEALKEPWFK